MTFISTVGQSNLQIERIKVMQQQLSTLQTQLATGKKTQLFSGLDRDVLTSKRARATVNMVQTYNQNIENANRRIKVMSNTIDGIRDQAGDLVNALSVQTQEGEFEMESVSDLARKTKDFLIELMNIQDGDRYLFGGADTTNPPVTDTGSLDTYVQGQFSDWLDATIDTDEFIDSYRDRSALNDTVMGYSSALSSGQAKSSFIRVDERTEIDFTIFANDSGFRDILAATSIIENIDATMDKVAYEEGDAAGTITAPGADKDAQNSNFYKMFNDVIAMLNGALDRVETVQFNLSQTQAQISNIKENNELEKNIMLENIAEVEDVDVNEVAVTLNTLQLQLEASYRVTASLQQFSLASFLGG